MPKNGYEEDEETNKMITSLCGLNLIKQGTQRKEIWITEHSQQSN